MKYFKILLFLSLAPLLYYVFSELELSSVSSPVPALGQSARDFTLDGFRLSSVRGKPIVLHFWATWCAPCVRELPDLLALAKIRKDIEFVAVSVDRDRATVERFFQIHSNLADLPKQVRLLVDMDGKVTGLYQTLQFPETFLINKSFVVDNKFVGSQSWTSPQVRGLLERLSR